MQYESYYRKRRKNFSIRAIVLICTIILGAFLIALNNDDWRIIVLSIILFGWPTLEFIFRVIGIKTKQKIEEEESGQPKRRYYTVEVREKFFGGHDVNVTETDEPLEQLGYRVIKFILISLVAIIFSPIISIVYLCYLIIRIISISIRLKGGKS